MAVKAELYAQSMVALRERRAAQAAARVSDAAARVGYWQPPPASRPILARQTALVAQQERAHMRLAHEQSHEAHAARVMGAPLISAEALGLSQAEYQQLVRLQFQGIF